MAVFALTISSLIGVVLAASAWIAGASITSTVGVYFAPSVLCILYLLDRADAQIA